MISVIDVQGFCGLRTQQALPAGEELFHLEHLPRREKPDRWSLQVGTNGHVDTTDSLVKYLNHSCEPNLEVAGYSVRTMRRIEEGEELTFDYLSTEWEMAEPFDCLCGCESCVGYVAGYRYLTKDQQRTRRVAHHLVYLASRGNELRQLMMDAVDRLGSSSPILLSGGVDSTAILAAQLQLNERPAIYTFRLKERESTDWRTSKQIAETFDLPFYSIEIPETELVADVKRVIVQIGSSRKVWVQCAYPFLYVLPKLQADIVTKVLWGVEAGSLLGDGRQAAVQAKQMTDEEERAFRYAYWHSDRSERGVVPWASSYGIQMCDPYRDEALGEFLLSIPWRELQKPRPKEILQEAFPEMFSVVPFRRHASYQINSGIRELHDTLLDDPELNPGGNQRVVAVYNRIQAELEAPHLF